VTLLSILVDLIVPIRGTRVEAQYHRRMVPNLAFLRPELPAIDLSKDLGIDTRIDVSCQSLNAKVPRRYIAGAGSAVVPAWALSQGGEIRPSYEALRIQRCKGTPPNLSEIFVRKVLPTTTSVEIQAGDLGRLGNVVHAAKIQEQTNNPTAGYRSSA
jgi:hypothetical protein